MNGLVKPSTSGVFADWADDGSSECTINNSYVPALQPVATLTQPQLQQPPHLIMVHSPLNQSLEDSLVRPLSPCPSTTSSSSAASSSPSESPSSPALKLQPQSPADTHDSSASATSHDACEIMAPVPEDGLAQNELGSPPPPPPRSPQLSDGAIQTQPFVLKSILKNPLPPSSIASSTSKTSSSSLSASPLLSSTTSSLKGAMASIAQRFSFKRNKLSSSSSPPFGMTSSSPVSKSAPGSPPKFQRKSLSSRLSADVDEVIKRQNLNVVPFPSTTTTTTTTTTASSCKPRNRVTFDACPPQCCTVADHWRRVTGRIAINASSEQTIAATSADDLHTTWPRRSPPLAKRPLSTSSIPSPTAPAASRSSTIQLNPADWHYSEWLDHWDEDDEDGVAEKEMPAFHYRFGPPPYETETRFRHENHRVPSYSNPTITNPMCFQSPFGFDLPILTP
ncbi:hypothetical protein HDU97_000425 [Phlyctochytrium planicorne]|nr:hypothetical protein HDU97_000425 [Phlyctochytrium planicorne]